MMSTCGLDCDISCKRMLIVMDSTSGVAISMNLVRVMSTSKPATNIIVTVLAAEEQSL